MSIRADAYPAALAAAEDELIRQRRQAVAMPRADGDAAHERRAAPDLRDEVDATRERVGVALSGGGIRSATFALGLCQSLAARRLLRRVDFLSTVSGGGYCGSFLTALFTRTWVRGVDDVEEILAGRATGGHRFASRVFRHLRDNGRYLAPRGPGDLLVMAATALRNWASVQVVLVTAALAAFVGLQLVRISIEAGVGLNDAGSLASSFLACTMPFGSRLVLWSPWLLVALVPLLLVAVPTAWAYWLVATRRGDERQVGINPIWGALVALAGAAAGLRYAMATNSAAAAVWALGATIAIVTFLCYVLAGLGPAAHEDKSSLARNRLSRWMTLALVATAGILAFGVVDSIGATIYAVTTRDALGRWAAAIVATLAGAAAFARPVAMMLSGLGGEHARRPGLPASVLAWAGAMVVLVVWLAGINVLSHAVAWRFEQPKGLPKDFAAASAPSVLGASELLITPGVEGFIVKAAMATPGACQPAAIERQASSTFPLAVFGGLLVASWLFGQSRSFANMSSLHQFYAARLTRAYLGASNESRLKGAVSISDVIDGDDVPASGCWRWPTIPVPKDGMLRSVRTFVQSVAWLRFAAPARETAKGPWEKGAPLHIVNVTVNETVDGLSGVQNQDRKGTSLAVGPAGLSLGVRHHLVGKADGGVEAFPPQAPHVHRVFSTDQGAVTPEPLPLGRWAGISGAAFTAAAGSQTTVPIAVLAGMFNVRLGYWWDSGMPAARWSTFARFFPVQAALLSEMLARTHGTAQRLWMLSDGGHFENMGAYELIRRRLPLIIVVDAEADPSYTFEGLANLVRKARLDFGAEVTFLDGRALADPAQGIPAEVRDAVGTLEMLRRGAWTEQPVPTTGEVRTRLAVEVRDVAESSGHAALARVDFTDGADSSWLVYVKASLTGDEPTDVRQYHAAHPAFPQETTLDQFFDEAQWESYRRLGEHVADAALPQAVFALAGSRPPAGGVAPAVAGRSAAPTRLVM